MHALLEYLPLIIFFAVYKMVDIFWATGAIIVFMAAQTLYMLLKKQNIPTRHWIIFVMVAGFGGLTIAFQNDLFIKWKVTVIYSFFAIALLVSDYFFQKNIIREFFKEALILPENVWRKLNMSWAGFFAAMAATNSYIAHFYSQEFWVNFKVFGLFGATIVFAFVSILFLYRYLPDVEEDQENQKQQEN